MPGATLEYSSSAPTPIKYPSLAPHSLLPTKEPDYLRLILTSKVYDLIKETPLVPAPGLSKKLGNDIWLKREDLQEVFSFKIRGAYNFMANLPVNDRWKGVVTCSAGMWAQDQEEFACDLRVGISHPRLIVFRQSCPRRSHVRRPTIHPMHHRHA